MNNAGFPRPVLPRNGQNTPLPWVGANKPEQGNWAGIDDDRAYEAEDDKLCIVCGLPLTSDFIYMLLNGSIKSERAGLSIFGEIPSPTWVHPKCGKIAALYCPHLKRHTHPAMTQNGHKLTHPQLTELARKADKPGKPDIR